MGLGPRLSFAGESCPPVGNPVPSRFTILESYARGDNHIAIKVNYPDARNYEGTKILVYRNVNVHRILSAIVLDPHFSDDGSLSPFARFEPTVDGWAAAKELVDVTSAVD
ncbi:hypothetical protein [Xanthomonas phage XacN1]|nr:hypothetical protein [Xanthomonas phage XacN1]